MQVLRKYSSGLLRSLAVVGIGVLLQGCAQWNAMMTPATNKGEPATVAAVAAPQKTAPAPKKPAAPKTSAPQKVKTPPTGKSITKQREAQMQQIDLSVYYLERIFLPEGSALNVTVSGQGLASPLTKAVKTKAGPPYTMKIDLPAGTKFPLTIKAELQALSGQSFNGTTTLNSYPTGTTEMRVSSAL